MANIGKSITQSVSLISKVGAECDLLAELVMQELSSLFGGGALGKRFQADGGWIKRYSEDEHGWVYVDSAFSLPLIIKPKRSVGAHLSVQISLAGDTIAATGNDEPLVHVCFWSGSIDFGELYMGFPLGDEGCVPELDEGVLFKWPELATGLQEWNYSLRLAEINSVQDVHEMIVEPVKALLSGSAFDARRLHSLRGIVRYSAVEDEPGQYRVEL
ncbi:hypothetical protein D3C78_1232750 [compost metagenome]